MAGKARLSIVSWNVNGIRACAKKGFASWLAEARPDVLGVQEVRAEEAQIPADVLAPEGYSTHFVSASRKGYSGVGLFVADRLKRARGVEISFDDCAIDGTLPLESRRKTSRPKESFDDEGRLQSVELGELLIVNGYFPNGSGKDRDNSRVPYKLEFYERLRARLQSDFEAGRPLLVMGDWNTAHQAVDLARPKQNEKTSGFMPEEREGFSRWIDSGWVDTFRHFVPASAPPPAEPGRRAPKLVPTGDYTWWSQRFGVREKNIGWRIDYVLASPGAVPHLRGAKIHPDVMGSDHCPISVEVDQAILRG